MSWSHKNGKIWEDLANKFAVGVNSYPYDLANSTNMFINYRKYVNNSTHPGRKKSKIK